MIQPRSIVKIADNTGARLGRVFKVLGGTRRRYARIGNRVVISIQEAEPKRAVKKKDICLAVVVRQKQPLRRQDGSYIRFDENAVVLLETGKTDPRGSRIFGPIPREIVELGYQKIASLATEIV